MSDNFKLDININQKEIEKMAKQVIREIVEANIQEVMSNIDIEKVIMDKISSSTNLQKIAEKAMKTEIDNIRWRVEGKLNDQLRDIILSEIQKKPLTGNVYLKLDGANVETDYDY